MKLREAGDALGLWRGRARIRQQVADSLASELSKAEEKIKALTLEGEQKTSDLQKATREYGRMRERWNSANLHAIGIKASYKHLMGDLKRELADLRSSCEAREEHFRSEEAISLTEARNLKKRAQTLSAILEKERASQRQLELLYQELGAAKQHLEEQVRAIIESLVERGLLPPSYLELLPPPEGPPS